MKDSNSLTHTKWNCKYHIVFAPKYRRQVIYGKLKTDIGTILRRLCEYKKIEILEASLCPDHVHIVKQLIHVQSASTGYGPCTAIKSAPLRGAFRHFPLYLILVAIPPLMWRSALFFSSTSLTWLYRGLLNCCRRSDKSLCTVDFEIPNFFAAARTVALLSMMYTARSQARSSMFDFKSYHSP